MSRNSLFVHRIKRAVAGLVVSIVVSLSGSMAVVAGFETYEDAMQDYRAGRFEQAFLALSELAQDGHEQAQFRLGLMFHQGRGAPRNYRLASEWYRKAADQGHAGAQNNLGVIYRDGEGVRSNKVVAYMWFSLAAAQFNDRARSSVDKLERELSRDQLLQAQQLTNEYMTNQWERKKARHSVSSASARGYMVQLGLFGNSENIARIRARLAEVEVPVVSEDVALKGQRYQRLRVGPFKTEQDAEIIAKRVDELFDLKSLVVALQ